LQCTGKESDEIGSETEREKKRDVYSILKRERGKRNEEDSIEGGERVGGG
jgi:hypothetical protein